MKIALLSFNRPGYLAQVIASIKTQSFDDYEMVYHKFKGANL
jgi:glycosyltransferase involved in cell wall biosynthesis